MLFLMNLADITQMEARLEMNGTSPILTEIYFKECVGFRNGNGNQD
jgi:hypothetical protein